MYLLCFAKDNYEVDLILCSDFTGSVFIQYVNDCNCWFILKGDFNFAFKRVKIHLSIGKVI